MYNKLNEVEYVFLLIHSVTGTLFFYKSNYNTKILRENTSLSNPNPV